MDDLYISPDSRIHDRTCSARLHDLRFRFIERFVCPPADLCEGLRPSGGCLFARLSSHGFS